MTLFNPSPTHNAISYNIQDLKEIYELIVNNYKYANETLNSIERHILTLQTQHFVDLYVLNIKHRKVHMISFNFISLQKIKLKYLYEGLFVINTDGNIKYTEKNYMREKKILEMRFPNPTSYEIPDKNSNFGNKTATLNEEEEEYNNYDEDQDIILNDSNKNNVNELKDDICKYYELENEALVKINSKQAFLLKTSNGLIVLMSLLNLLLLYLYCSIRRKNKNRYYQLNDYEKII